jgi:hypothetical protein
MESSRATDDRGGWFTMCSDSFLKVSAPYRGRRLGFHIASSVPSYLILYITCKQNFIILALQKQFFLLPISPTSFL